MASEVRVEAADQAAQPMFATAEERELAAVALSVSVTVLPEVGVVVGSVVEPEAVIDEPPRLNDTEWKLIQPVLDQWKGIKPSRVSGREFIDLCLTVARLKFHWSLLEAETNCESCRKRSERMCTNKTGNRWRDLYEAVGDQIRPEVAMLLNAWVVHGDDVRTRTLQLRERLREKLLIKAN